MVAEDTGPRGGEDRVAKLQTWLLSATKVGVKAVGALTIRGFSAHWASTTWHRRHAEDRKLSTLTVS